MEDRTEALLNKASMHLADLDRIAQRAAEMAEAAAATIARVANLKHGPGTEYSPAATQSPQS
jgi:hypothetical protein